MSTQTPSIKKGQEILVHIEKAAYEGKGLGFVDGKACFILNTAPGDVVRARVTVRKKAYLEAKLLEIITPSENRIAPRCQHAPVCGGCSWQHVPYTFQTEFKRQHVEDHMRRIGNLTEISVLPVISSERDFYYRNKMEYSFGDRRWLSDDEIASGETFEKDSLALGLHVPGRYDRILNLHECHLQESASFDILNHVRGYALQQNLTPYNTHQKLGWLRHLVIRNSLHTNEWMVNIVTFYEDENAMTGLVQSLKDTFPFITTIIESVNDTWSPVAIGTREHVHYGSGFITDSIGSYHFRIHPTTFFQTNTMQAERLFQTAIDLADIQGGIVYDLYCGVGTLSLFAAKNADSVVGVELNPQSIQNAIKNASDNDVQNTVFRTGDARDTFSDALLEECGRPDILLTDPPRVGMHQDVVMRLNELSIPTIVYVSCNSATMARDLALMSDAYEITHIQPVDMFPQTYHIETVARLVAKDSTNR